MSDEPELPRWEHRKGDEYVIIRPEMWMNESGYGTHYYCDGVRRGHAASIRHGIRTFGHDDFNLGAIRDGRLVALLWQHEVVDDGPDVLAKVAEQTGLLATVDE